MSQLNIAVLVGALAVDLRFSENSFNVLIYWLALQYPGKRVGTGNFLVAGNLMCAGVCPSWSADRVNWRPSSIRWNLGTVNIKASASFQFGYSVALLALGPKQPVQ